MFNCFITTYDISFLDTPPFPLINVASVVNLTINNYNLTMKCLSDRDHIYAYTWIKKNDIIFPLRTQGINSSLLTIFNLKPEDAGDYQCVVSNRTGKISSNFSSVDVIGKYSYLNSLQLYLHVSQCSIFTNNHTATR